MVLQLQYKFQFDSSTSNAMQEDLFILIRDRSLYMGGEGMSDKMGGSEIFRKKWRGVNLFKHECGRNLIIVTILTTQCFTVAFVCLLAPLAVTTACSGKIAASRRNAFFKYFLLFKVLSIHKNYQLIFEGVGGRLRICC